MDQERPILAVEDSDEDFFSLTQSLQALGIRNPVKRCADSRAALLALDSAEGCADARAAALILLDLNMPGVDGHRLLERFRQLEKCVPVIVLSSSAHAIDVERSYRAGANAYLVKPLDLAQWERMLRTAAEFWFGTARLAPPSRPVVRQ